jgi:transcriptional regulator with XRE-family HTH domain
VSFSPPPDAKHSAIRPGEGWYSCGWRLLEAWLAERAWVYAQLGEAVGCSKALISGWKSGRPANAPYPTRLEQLCGIAPEAWTWWTQDEPLDASARPSSPPPASEKRAAKGPALDVPLGSTREELDSTIRQIDVALREGVTDGQRVQLLGKRASALMSRARLEERQAIHEHPDFTPLVEDLVLAVRSALGPDAPDGIESRIADELEALQAARAVSAVGRAA